MPQLMKGLFFFSRCAVKYTELFRRVLSSETVFKSDFRTMERVGAAAEELLRDGVLFFHTNVVKTESKHGVKPARTPRNFFLCEQSKKNEKGRCDSLGAPPRVRTSHMKEEVGSDEKAERMLKKRQKPLR